MISNPPPPPPSSQLQVQPNLPLQSRQLRQDIARAAFALLEKLDSGRRRPPPSIAKVFRLYCMDCLSASQVARLCRCSKDAVLRRLKLIRQRTGLPIALLRNLHPHPLSLDGLPPASLSRANLSNLLYAGAAPDDLPE